MLRSCQPRILRLAAAAPTAGPAVPQLLGATTQRQRARQPRRLALPPQDVQHVCLGGGARPQEECATADCMQRGAVLAAQPLRLRVWQGVQAAAE